MFQFAPTRRAGFECGTTGARMVVLELRNGVLHVERVYMEDVLFESRFKGAARTPLETARQLLLHKSMAGCKTVFTAPGAIESGYVILPKMGKADTASAVLLQAGKLLSWETENPLSSFTRSDFLRDRSGYLVGLADWKAVKAWMRLFEAGDALVDDVTVAACAFETLAARQKWADEFPVVLVADLGATKSWFYVVDRLAVRFMRQAPVGGDTMTKALTTVISTEVGAIELTDEQAEDVKTSGYLPSAQKREAASGDKAATKDGAAAGAGGLQQMEALVRPVIERIASEISRSMQFYRDNAGKQVDAVFLTGGAARFPILLKHLEQSVGSPVRIIDPFAGLPFAGESVRNSAQKNAARLAVAAGLALAEKPSITLMPRHLHIMKRLACFMPRAVLGVLLFVFLPLLVFGIVTTIRIRSVKNEMRQYEPVMEQGAVKQQYQVEIRRQVEELGSSLQCFQDIVERQPLWPGVLNALAAAVPDDVVLTMVAYGVDPRNPNSLLMGGKVLASAARFDDAMSSLLAPLGSSVFFRKVTIINAQATPMDEALGTFEIQCELVY